MKKLNTFYIITHLFDRERFGSVYAFSSKYDKSLLRFQPVINTFVTTWKYCGAGDDRAVRHEEG